MRKAVAIRVGTLVTAFLAIFWTGALLCQEAKEDGPGVREVDFEEFVPYLEDLNEFLDRRRLNVYFPNEQPISYGAQIGRVNVGKGNLTFVRRDLVAVGRIPLVAARAYDSSLEGGVDFGPGWKLTLAEVVRIAGDGTASFFDETGAEISFVANQTRFVAARPAPTDIVDFRQTNEQRLEMTLRSGFVKQFDRLPAELEPSGAAVFRLTLVNDRNNNFVRLIYSGEVLSEVHGSNGRAIRFERDEAGRVVAVEDDQGRRVRYLYDQNDRLSEVVDFGHNRWRYEYHDDGRLFRAIDPLSHPNIEAFYDEAGRVIEIESAGGYYRYSYGPGETTVLDGRQGRSVYAQNSDGITVMMTNPLGSRTRLQLGEGNRVVRLFRNEELTGELDYDSDGRLASIVRHGVASDRWVLGYSDQGLLARIDNASASVEFLYDSRGNLVEERERSLSTRYRYSQQGDLVGKIRILKVKGNPQVSVGSQPEQERNQDDSKVTVLSTTLFEYNKDGQITSITDELGRTASFEYLADGRLGGVSFPDGSSRAYGYDPLGLRKRVDFSDGAMIDYQYSPAGSLNAIRVTTPQGQVSSQFISLDEEQKVRVIENQRGEELRIAYDDLGNVVAMSADNGGTSFAYDGTNRLVEVITSDGDRLRYRYREGEPDIRTQFDKHTPVSPSNRTSTGLTFAGSFELLHNRTLRSEFGSVVFDSASMEFSLLANRGFLGPDAVRDSAMERMRILGLGSGDAQTQAHFNAPSNILFIPPEYASLNCCIESCGVFFCDPGTCFQPNFDACCNGQCQQCRNQRTSDRGNAFLTFAVAEAACLAGVCATQGTGSQACIACLGGAAAALLIRLDTIDAVFQGCVALSTFTCQISTGSTSTCPLCNP